MRVVCLGNPKVPWDRFGPVVGDRLLYRLGIEVRGTTTRPLTPKTAMDALEWLRKEPGGAIVDVAMRDLLDPEPTALGIYRPGTYPFDPPECIPADLWHAVLAVSWGLFLSLRWQDGRKSQAAFAAKAAALVVAMRKGANGPLRVTSLA